MCGISGFVSFDDSVSEQRLGEYGVRMAAALTHRGPDDFGAWCDPACGVVLSHRRLSIIDLSAAGHQPMVSPDGRYVVVTNGEIYNFRALRADLEKAGFAFIGHSDTEVAVAAIQRWGLDGALTRFVGMFALAVWDRRDRVLCLARDRAGEKPLYCGWLKQGFVFGSELKALCAHPQWAGRINRDALTLLLRYAYIPAPHSIYEGIYKVMPGCWIKVAADTPRGRPRVQAYWSADDMATDGIAGRQTRAVDDVIAELDELLHTTIADKMIADVPLGAFLSGGIDSSLVAALMQRQSTRPVKTFSIGFNEAEYNEAPYAKAVADHLGTDHTELYVTPEETQAVIPRIPTLYDEPFADSSQIPTYLIAQLARRDVTVALSGDAGDELFGGYTRYFIGRETWGKIERVPAFVRGLGGSVIKSTPPRLFDAAMGLARPLLPRRFRYHNVGQKLHKLAHVWGSASHDAVYSRLVSLFEQPGDIVIGATEPDWLGRHRATADSMADLTDRMMYTDLVTYLPDDILVKVDRASMAVSLEVRVPLLDHRVMEFAWRQPLGLKIRGNQGKWLLRQVLYKYVPPALIDRPKMGFGVPIDHWLRGPLRDWAAALLDENRLRQEGFLEPAPIREKWDAHQTGNYSMQYYLWPVLMFQSWLEHHTG